MAAKLAGGGKGKYELGQNSDINVTPFVDVMLVLLIIFMVAAPLATVDIAVNLPASTAEPQPRPDKPVYLTVKSDLTLATPTVVIVALTSCERSSTTSATIPGGRLSRIRRNFSRTEAATVRLFSPVSISAVPITTS